MFAELVTITVAFIAVVLARYVRPPADQLEGKQTVPALPEA